MSGFEEKAHIFKQAQADDNGLPQKKKNEPHTTGRITKEETNKTKKQLSKAKNYRFLREQQRKFNKN